MDAQALAAQMQEGNGGPNVDNIRTIAPGVDFQYFRNI